MKFNSVDPASLATSPNRIFVSHEIIDSIPPRELRLLETGNGALLGGVDLREREIHLFLNFKAQTIDKANELASDVAALFCTDTPQEYEPNHMPGRAFTAILRDASQMEWKWGTGVIEYTFSALRPFSHSTTETVVNTTGTTISLSPSGDVPLRPVITHTMSAAASALVYSLGGNVFFKVRNPLGTDLPQGAVVVVDFENRLVTVGGNVSMPYVDYTVSDWHPDLVGSSISITCSDSGATEVRYRDEWM